MFGTKKLKNEISGLDFKLHLLQQLVVDSVEIRSKNQESFTHFIMTTRPYELKIKMDDWINEFIKVKNIKDLKEYAWGGQDYTINPAFRDFIWNKIKENR